MNGPSEVGNDPTFEPARTSPIYDTPVTEPHEIARAAAILEEREKIPLSNTQCEQIEEAVEAPRTEGHTTFQPMAVKVKTTGKKGRSKRRRPATPNRLHVSKSATDFRWRDT